MAKDKKATINVMGTAIAVVAQQETDYISLTDIARHRDSERTDYLIQNWMRSRNTIEFLGIWESLNNPRFKPIEFDGFRKQAGLNSFILTAKQWMRRRGLKMRDMFSPHPCAEILQAESAISVENGKESSGKRVRERKFGKVPKRKFLKGSSGKTAERYGTIFLTSGRWSSDGMKCSIPEKDKAANCGDFAIIKSRTGDLNLSKSRGLECPSEVRV